MAYKAVGLTGGIGSGKSTVAELFAKLGVMVIDADVIAHDLTGIGGAAMPEIRAVFGDELCLADGALNRNAMRELVFADPSARSRLEEIIHPLILEKCRQMLDGVQAPYALLVVPLLFETSSFLSLVQRTLVVDCDESTQLSRVMARDGMTKGQAEAILFAQSPRQARLDKADDVIFNNADIVELSEQVNRKHQDYLAYF